MDVNWLEQAAQLCLILTFLGGLFAFAVMRPLNDTLKELRIAIDALRQVQNSQTDRLNKLEVELNEIKYAMQKAHDRIDEFLHKGASHHEKS